MTDQAVNEGDYLKIRNLRQLTTIDIDLSKQVTLIAGANGSGKTTILRILAQLVGWPAGPKPTTPQSTLEGALLGEQIFAEADWDPLVRVFERGLGRERAVHNIAGIFVPAQRRGYVPGLLTNIPVGWEGAGSLLEQYQSDERNGFRLGTADPMAPNLTLKAGLVVSALNGFVTGPGVEPNNEARELFETYTETLRSLLPEALGFKRIIVRSPEVFLEIADGEVPLDSVSGGTASMLDMAWQITLATRAVVGPFVVLIDELENHLHPAAQRTALPALVKAFPTAKFVVATHSPHVFASIEDATHVVLKRADVGFISEMVDMPASLLTPDEVLREALGLDVTMPVWVEEKLGEITSRHQDTLVGDGGFESLRDDLDAAGLGRLLPSATARILESQP